MRRNTTRKNRQPAAWKQLADGRLDRAIFLDFESFKTGPPVLAGVQIDGHFEQVVFDPRLRQAADHKGLEVVDSNRWLRWLVERAVREDRLIVAFSTAESRTFAELDIPLPADRYVNALKIAKTWRWKLHRGVAKQVRANRKRWKNSAKNHLRNRWFFREGNRLIDFAKLADVTPPGKYGSGKVTTWLKTILGQLDRKNDFALLTPRAKGKWTSVLNHNRFDVVGLAEALGRIVNDLRPPAR